MKKRILALILLIAFTITGCGSSKPNEELDKFAEEIIVNPDGNAVDAEPTIVPSDVPTEVPTDTTPAGGEETATDGEPAAEKEKYFVTFTATTTEGEEWNSENFANSKLTMINVWATYCNPCLSEMPDLGELSAEYDASDFQIIGVVSDVMAEDSGKNVEYAKQLIEETKANYLHLLLNESLYMSFVGAVSAVPTTFFVRRDGSMVGYLTGAMAKEDWKTLIDDLLTKEQ